MGQEINEEHLEEQLRNLAYFDMKRRGVLTLDAVASTNEPDALELIQELLRSGKSPMEQDSQKLFPYHFAKNREVYAALTPPPIDRRSYLLTLARSNLTEDAKICFLKNVLDNSIPCDMSHMTFTGEDSLSCIGIAAQTREYRFAQSMVYVAEQGENARRSSEIDKMKVDHKEEIEIYQTENEKLKKEATGNVMMEDEEIKRKLDIAVERIGILAFENDVLKDNSCKKEELLKAEILNLNKCISRQKAKCADLSTGIDKLKKESAIFTERVTNMESERKKKYENLKIEIDMLKRDADLQKVQSENSINTLQDENQQLHERLKGVRNIKMQAQEHIRQLNELFDVENSSQSEIRVKELEDQIAALKTVNTDLESISKKFEEVTSCSLCDEKYESTGKHAPVKLKCRHVFCSHCATNWLKSQGNKSSCPSCREPYRSEDIRFVYLNTDL